MLKTNNTNEEICARKTLGPLLILISLLIVATIVLAFYFSDEIRQRRRDNKARMQIGGFKLPGPGGQNAGRHNAVIPAQPA